MSGYQPGRCNIGRTERWRRATIAGIGFGLAALTVFASAVGVLPAPLFAIVFVFLAIGFEWGLQAYTAFCVRLALLNRYDFRGQGGDRGTVSDPRAQNADQLQAAKITVASVIAAGITTGLLTLLFR